MPAKAKKPDDKPTFVEIMKGALWYIWLAKVALHHATALAQDLARGPHAGALTLGDASGHPGVAEAVPDDTNDTGDGQ